MINLKTAKQIDLMRDAGYLTGDVLKLMEENIRPGISTLELDKMAYDFIVSHGATPSFLHYMRYPKSICASIDDEVVHGIPRGDRILQEGQIISIDVGAKLKGYHGDAARTFAVGKISREKERLIRVTRESFYAGLEHVRDGAWLRDVSAAIQEHAEARGFSVVRDLVGHGIGRSMHEDPSVPNFVASGTGIRLRTGMTLAIEPMINQGAAEVNFGADGWTVTTKDGLCSAHYENTIVVTETGYEILTIREAR